MAMSSDGRTSRGVARVRQSLRGGKLKRGIDSLLVWANQDAPTLPAHEGPLAFDRWAETRSARHDVPFSAQWREVSSWRQGRPARVGVVVHVYFAELVPQLLDAFRAIDVPFDLIVTNSSGEDLELPEDVGARQLLLPTVNRGRDILPLLSVVNAGLLDPYDLVLKVHTKKSQWRGEHELHGDGAQWRDELLTSLLGDGANVSAILAAFAGDPSLGIVTADDSVLGPEYWGDNEQLVAQLLRRIELDLDPSALVFAAGSMYWIRGFLLASMRSLDLDDEDFELESGQTNQTTAHAVERALGVLCLEAGLQIRGRGGIGAKTGDPARYDPETELVPRARAVPFYLPQFHQIPENDAWWGDGFTEWTNVAAARPIYAGHDQPKLPEALGFYDLRNPDVAQRQIALARAAGLAGFMYYRYWFSGQELLQEPLEIRRGLSDDFAFCLMWANENWTRTWSGGHDDVLMAQDYQRVPATDFIDSVMHLLTDPRYLRVQGKAVLAVYRPRQMDDIAAVVASWRERARQEGAGELLLLAVDVGSDMDGLPSDVSEFGFDGTMGFPPHNHHWWGVDHAGLGLAAGIQPRILSYRAMADAAIQRGRQGHVPSYYPAVMVGFDNTARRQRTPDVWWGANPYTYFRWLSAVVESVMDRPLERRLVFINAWNEWAESAVLEPTQRMGKSFLTATRAALLS